MFKRKMLLKMIEIDFLPELLSREERQPPQDRMLKVFTNFTSIFCGFQNSHGSMTKFCAFCAVVVVGGVQILTGMKFVILSQ